VYVCGVVVVYFAINAVAFVDGAISVGVVVVCVIVGGDEFVIVSRCCDVGVVLSI